MKSFFALVVLVLIGFIGKSHSQVLSETADQSIPTVTQQPVPTSTKIPDNPSPTPVIKVINNDWQYPGSQSQSANIFESTDAASTITDWYVAKIKSMELPVTSFVKTNTNGQVLNKLAAAKDNLNITITISQESESKLVVITIDNH